MVEIIPVIDLCDGQVVAARGGDRSAYAPSSSPLCASSDPLEVVAAYGTLADFRCLYVADLDAIESRGDNLAALRRIRGRYPELEIWLDDGLHDLAAGLGVRSVVGSESLLDRQQAGRLLAVLPRPVLSLDFREGRLLGGLDGFDADLNWPDTLIVMALHRVGSGQGPDLELLQRVARSYPREARLFAAGGVRDLNDLLALRDAGISGALLATALHSRAIDADDLRRLSAT